MLLSLLFSLFQESLVDFWFQKLWITVVFSIRPHISLCTVKAISLWLEDIFNDFFSHHRINVYLFSEINFYFTHALFVFGDIFTLLCLFTERTLFVKALHWKMWNTEQQRQIRRPININAFHSKSRRNSGGVTVTKTKPAIEADVKLYKSDLIHSQSRTCRGASTCVVPLGRNRLFCLNGNFHVVLTGQPK